MSGWDKSPSEFAENIEDAIPRVLKEATLMLVTNLTIKTPVDTGRARANWYVSTNGFLTQTTSTGFGKVKKKTEKRTIIRGSKGSKTSIERAKKINTEGKKKVFISNNLPYIGFLEHGTPNMKPFSMVESSIRITAKQLKWEIK